MATFVSPTPNGSYTNYGSEQNQYGLNGDDVLAPSSDSQSYFLYGGNGDDDLYGQSYNDDSRRPDAGDGSHVADGPASPTLLRMAEDGLVHVLASDSHSPTIGRPLMISHAVERLAEIDFLRPHLEWITTRRPGRDAARRAHQAAVRAGRRIGSGATAPRSFTCLHELLDDGAVAAAEPVAQEVRRARGRARAAAPPRPSESPSQAGAHRADHRVAAALGGAAFEPRRRQLPAPVGGGHERGLLAAREHDHPGAAVDDLGSMASADRLVAASARASDRHRQLPVVELHDVRLPLERRVQLGRGDVRHDLRPVRRRARPCTRFPKTSTGSASCGSAPQTISTSAFRAAEQVSENRSSDLVPRRRVAERLRDELALAAAPVDHVAAGRRRGLDQAALAVAAGPAAAPAAGPARRR